MRFDVCAHTYDEHAGPQRFFAERVAQFIGAKSTENILELGAGTGALTRHLIGAPASGPAALADEHAGSETGAPILTEDSNYIVNQKYDMETIDPTTENKEFQTQSTEFIDFSDADPFAEGEGI